MDPQHVERPRRGIPPHAALNCLTRSAGGAPASNSDDISPPSSQPRQVKHRASDYRDQREERADADEQEEIDDLRGYPTLW